MWWRGVGDLKVEVKGALQICGPLVLVVANKSSMGLFKGKKRGDLLYDSLMAVNVDYFVYSCLLLLLLYEKMAGIWRLCYEGQRL